MSVFLTRTRLGLRRMLSPQNVKKIVTLQAHRGGAVRHDEHGDGLVEVTAEHDEGLVMANVAAIRVEAGLLRCGGGSLGRYRPTGRRRRACGGRSTGGRHVRGLVDDDMNHAVFVAFERDETVADAFAPHRDV